jgi:hypothetical protein
MGAVILVALVVIAVWAGSLYLWPFRPCPRCNGTGRDSGSRKVRRVPQVRGQRPGALRGDALGTFLVLEGLQQRDRHERIAVSEYDDTWKVSGWPPVEAISHP